MTLIDGLVLALVGGPSLLLGAAWLRAIFRARALEELPEIGAPPPGAWPRLSVIVAACNEGATLGAPLETLLAQDYPNLELVVVNDRSTDDTRSVLEALAARDPRITAIHIEHLPEGWLGKVHALHVASARASGEWLLYTDADVHFAPGTLRRAVDFSAREGLEHLTLIAEVETDSYALQVACASFGIGLILTTRADEIGREGSTAYLGIGAFNLVRRAALERSEGFEWIRMEVADDTGLALVLHRAGARSRVLLGRGHVHLRWYEDLGEMMRGLEKNMFGVGAHFSDLRAALSVLALVLVSLAPLAAFLPLGVPHLWLAGAWVVATTALMAALIGPRFGVPFTTLLAAPAGLVIFAAILLRSWIQCRRRGGIVWRGTHYPLEQLRRGRRVDL